MIAPRLTDEQRQAIGGHPGDLTRVEDDQTHKVYFLIEESRANELYDRWLHEQLQVGFDEADRSQAAEWDLEAFLANMHRQHAGRSTAAE